MIALPAISISRLLALLAASALVIGCIGGSGSSGFDLTESLAITRVAQDGACEDFEGLTICPAGAVPPASVTASATPTNPTPTPAATGTPATTDSPDPAPTATMAGPETSPSANATASPPVTPTPDTTIPTTPTQRPATATAQPTHTPTPTAVAAMDIFTDAGAAQQPLSCQPTERIDVCAIGFEFSPVGFPPASAFRIASRLVGAEVPWHIVAPAGIDIANGASRFAAAIEVDRAASASEGTTDMVQLVVLAFESEPGPVPERVTRLVDTGADLAFVVPPVAIFVE